MTRPPAAEGHIRQPGEIFVFSACLDAGRTVLTVAVAKLFGADPRVVEGPTGQAYALPMWLSPGVALSRIAIAEHAMEFAAYARAHPELTFFLPALRAGPYTDPELAACFHDLPPNIRIPPEWGGWLGRARHPEEVAC